MPGAQPAAGLPASGKLEGDQNPGKPGFGWGDERTAFVARANAQ